MLTKHKLKMLLASGALALFSALSPAVYANASYVKDMADVDQTTEETTQSQMAEKRKEILSEATNAIRETQNALRFLDEENDKDALAALESATGKLEIILAREPSLALAPSSANVVTYDVLADIDAVQTLRDQAEEALSDGRVQDARRMIRNLASEIIVRVSNIPLATYPDAIKLAVKHIDDGERADAKEVLQTALSTLVVTDTIFPRPVITAESLLQKAEILAEKTDRSDEESTQLTDLLDRTRTQLRFAQVLGYGRKNDFKNIYQQLDQIEDKTNHGKSGKGFFEKIKGFLSDTMEASQQESSVH